MPRPRLRTRVKQTDGTICECRYMAPELRHADMCNNCAAKKNFNRRTAFQKKPIWPAITRKVLLDDPGFHQKACLFGARIGVITGEWVKLPGRKTLFIRVRIEEP